MHVLVQRDVSSRWRNRFVVVILLAIVGIQLSTFRTPRNDPSEVAQTSAVIAELRAKNERDRNLLAAKSSQEKVEADSKLQDLSRRLIEQQKESDQKLEKMAAALDQQKRETERQVAEHTQWLERMAGQIAKAKRDPIAANGAAKPIQGQLRFVLPGPKIADLQGGRDDRGAGPKQQDLRAETPIEAGPDHALLFRHADGLYHAGKYADAAEVYAELIERFPRSKASYLRRADCFASLRMFDKAIVDFTKAVDLWPDDSRAYLGRSWAYLGKGAADRALADADTALRLEPTLAEAHRIRAEAFARKGQPAEAGAARADALSGFYQRGVNSIVKRDYAAGIADLERVIKQAPGDAEARRWCARACYLHGEYARAISELSKVVELEPNDKQAYNERGMAHLRMREYGSAISDFDQAIALDRSYSEPYLNRGTARLAVGEAERAAEDFSKVLELEPGSAAEAYRLRSVAFAQQGLPTKAASDQRIADALGE